jgi:hypothetical protein
VSLVQRLAFASEKSALYRAFLLVAKAPVWHVPEREQNGDTAKQMAVNEANRKARRRDKAQCGAVNIEVATPSSSGARRTKTLIISGSSPGEIAERVVQITKNAQGRGDKLTITKVDGGLQIEIVRRKTKPNRPNAFPYKSILDPQLQAEWKQRGMLCAVIRGTLQADGSPTYTRAYVTGPMVAIATGRSARAVEEWASESRFIPSHQIGRERLWAADDLERLLNEGAFFPQSIHDKGHPGERAARILEALDALEIERQDAAALASSHDDNTTTRTHHGEPNTRDIEGEGTFRK